MRESLRSAAWTRLVFLALTAALAASMACSGKRGQHTITKYDVISGAESLVKSKLKAPSTADFPSASDFTVEELGRHRWRVSSYVDAQNAFGAMIRQNWTCTITYDPSDNMWRTPGVQFQ